MGRNAVTNVAEDSRERVYTTPSTVLNVQATAKVPKRLSDEHDDDDKE